MDWRTSPLQLVAKIFESRQDHAEPWEQRLGAQFESLLSNPNSLSSIPCLNSTPNHELSDGQLVRFRAMVQDMFDPEIYLAQYETRHLGTGEVRLQCGRYRDVLPNQQREEILEDSEHAQMQDRLVMYCVSIPAEAPWVSELRSPVGEAKPGPSGTSLNPLKRIHEPASSSSTAAQEDSAMDMDGEDNARCHLNGNGEGGKRARNDADNEEILNNNPTSTTTTTTTTSNNSFQTNISTASSSNSNATARSPLHRGVDLNLPIPNSRAKAAIVKLYEHSTDIRLTDMLELVGVVSLDPALAQHEHQDEDMMMMSTAPHLPPPSLVPRLHVVSYTKLTHNNPLVVSGSLSWSVAEMSGARSQLIHILTEALLGDRLAAEYLLCHLVSKVYSRRDVMVLGKMCLNLHSMSANSNWTRRLSTILQLLTTNSHYLPLSRQQLETTNFVPHKDFEANRLVSGMLQLPKGTHLILDETAMTDGQLSARGVQNLTSLGNLITWQKVDYDFKYHSLEYETDIPVLVLSEGRSMLPADFQLRVKPEGCTEQLASLVDTKYRAIGSLLNQDLLARLRRYLTMCRELDYSLSESLQKEVQEDFVRMRQAGGGGGHQGRATVDDLHAHLVLARFVATSHGQSTLTPDQWNRVKAMEEERRTSRVPPPRPEATLPNGLGLHLNTHA